MKKLLCLLPLACCLAQTPNPRAVQFTGDADCGISSSKTYTHLVDLGCGNTVKGPSYFNPVVNGVTFHSLTNNNATSGAMPAPNAHFKWTGSPQTTHPGSDEDGLTPAGGRAIATPTTDGIYKVLYDMHYNTANGTLELSGLTPGKTYEFRLYLRAWRHGHERSQRLTFSNGVKTDVLPAINPDAAAKKDQYVAYRYVAGSSVNLQMKYDVTSPNTTATLHMYGFSNEWIDGTILPGAVETTDNAATINAALENPNAVPYDCFAVLVSASGGNPGPGVADWLNAPGAFVSSITNLADGAIALKVGGLAPDTEYLARLFATNATSSSLSAAFPVTTKNTVPEIRATGAVSVAETSAIAAGWLDWAGSEFGSADVVAFWGKATAPPPPASWQGLPVATNQAAGEVAIPIAGLAPDTEYKYCLAATNGSDSAVSQTVFFRTAGAPRFNSTAAVNPSPGVFEARADIALCAPSGGTAIVTCWIGKAADALAPAFSWQDCEGATNLSHIVSGILIEGVRYCAFDIHAELGGKTWWVWSATNSVNVTAQPTPSTGRTLTWNNAASPAEWDTASANWLNNTAPATFQNGDSVAFSPAGSASVELREDAVVNNFSVNVPAGAAWTLDGARALAQINNAVFTTDGAGEKRINTSVDWYSMTMRGGTIRIADGARCQIRFSTPFDYGNTGFIITNATLTLKTSDWFSMGRNASPACDGTFTRIQHGGVLNALTIRMGETSGKNLLRVDGGAFLQSGSTNVGGSYSNRVEVVNKGLYNSTGALSIGVGTHHGILVDNATMVLDDGNLNNSNNHIYLGSGNGIPARGFHELVIQNNSVVTNGKIRVGDGNACNRMVVRNSTVVCVESTANYDTFMVGNNTGAYSNKVEILDNSTFITRGGFVVGNTGSYNTLYIENSTFTSTGGWGGNISRGSNNSRDNVMIIGPGAEVTIGSQITVCQNANPGGNELRLAGGNITSQGKFEFYNGAILGVEIQANGLPGCLHLKNNNVDIHTTTRLRPRAVKGAPPGEYLVIKSDFASTNLGRPILDPPKGQEGWWEKLPLRDGNRQLWIKYNPPRGTLFLVR